MRKRVDKLPKCTSVIRLMKYYRMAECIAYGTHYDMVGTYDAAVKHDSFGIVT